MAGRQFKSKFGAMNKRKHCWACVKCPAVYETKETVCHECHNQVMYFPSQAELRRYRSLQLEQRAGVISGLQLQPSYPVVINGQKVCEYRADFKYVRGEQPVIEDCKGTMNDKYHDPVFKLKKKLIEAIYGIEISIVT